MTDEPRSVLQSPAGRKRRRRICRRRPGHRARANGARSHKPAGDTSRYLVLCGSARDAPARSSCLFGRHCASEARVPFEHAWSNRRWPIRGGVGIRPHLRRGYTAPSIALGKPLPDGSPICPSPTMAAPACSGRRIPTPLKDSVAAMTYAVQPLAPGSFDLLLDGEVIRGVVRNVHPNGDEAGWRAKLLVDLLATKCPPSPHRSSRRKLGGCAGMARDHDPDDYRPGMRLAHAILAKPRSRTKDLMYRPFRSGQIGPDSDTLSKPRNSSGVSFSFLMVQPAIGRPMGLTDALSESHDGASTVTVIPLILYQPCKSLNGKPMHFR